MIIAGMLFDLNGRNLRRNSHQLRICVFSRIGMHIKKLITSLLNSEVIKKQTPIFGKVDFI